MKSRVRCSPTYLEKGVKVCDEWLASYEVFRDWAIGAGACQSVELDRIDNEGDYCPDNCRWITHAENCRNKGPRKRRKRSQLI